MKKEEIVFGDYWMHFKCELWTKEIGRISDKNSPTSGILRFYYVNIIIFQQRMFSEFVFNKFKSIKVSQKIVNIHDLMSSIPNEVR